MLPLLALLIGLQPGMARIDAGHFKPLYTKPGVSVVQVRAFALDTLPVSQKQLAAFLRRDASRASAALPATHVSLATAQAYCKAHGKRLPTTNEWEYAASADERRRDASHDASFKQRVLEIALRTKPAAYRLGSGLRNVWGVRDLHGGLHEWTSDVETFLGHDPSKHNGSITMCASGTVQTGDASDYAAFMRYAYRANMKSGMTTAGIGFRCAV